MDRGEFERVLKAHELWVLSDGERGRRADLTGVDLAYGDLTNCILARATLAGARLRDVDLTRAVLPNADLTGADLSLTVLKDTIFDGAVLTDTILDPLNTYHSTPGVLAEAGLRVAGDYAYGWRTSKSRFYGGHTYEPGKTYTAPVFSVCTETSCHPGIYLAADWWLGMNGYETPGVEDRGLVRVRALVTDCVVVKDKIRARKIEVLDNGLEGV